MKKTIILLILALLLLLPTAAYAEEGVYMEVITMDGVSVVVLTPETIQSRTLQGEDEKETGFRMPLYLTGIEESAFEGIDAKCVEISENVESIAYHAFAKCENLREFHISESVKEIDDKALEGCSDVTVYGTTEVAKNFAEANGFTFKDPTQQEQAQAKEQPPVTLPAVLR